LSGPTVQQNKKTNSSALGSHLLIGDFEENFYQLGLSDQKNYATLKKHLLALYKNTSNLRGKICPFNRYRSWINAYAEGLGENPERLFHILSIPEYLASPQKSKYVIPFGCSSLFHRNETSTFHGRVLDNPWGDAEAL
jgi:hypothetical protein